MFYTFRLRLYSPLYVSILSISRELPVIALKGAMIHQLVIITHLKHSHQLYVSLCSVFSLKCYDNVLFLLWLGTGTKNILSG